MTLVNIHCFLLFLLISALSPTRALSTNSRGPLRKKLNPREIKPKFHCGRKTRHSPAPVCSRRPVGGVRPGSSVRGWVGERPCLGCGGPGACRRGVGVSPRVEWGVRARGGAALARPLPSHDAPHAPAAPHARRQFARVAPSAVCAPARALISSIYLIIQSIY
jgi:hypothetical protein